MISSPLLFSHSQHLTGIAHVPPPPPPLHRGRGGRRPRPTADTRVPKGVLGPRRFRHPPSLLWRAPPVSAAPRLPPIPLTAPRGEVTAPCPCQWNQTNWTVLGSGLLQLPQKEARGRERFKRGLLLLQRRLQGQRQGDTCLPISLAIFAYLRVFHLGAYSCDA